MADSATFTLTHDQFMQIKQWEKDKTTLESEIAERQRKLNAISEKLKAVAILGAQAPNIEPQKSPPNGKDDIKFESATSNLAKAVERIAKASPTPISKADLKGKLIAEGFVDNRLGPYFYTVIARLKGKNRIQVLDDGRIWRRA
jgi:hypothetical protein